MKRVPIIFIGLSLLTALLRPINSYGDSIKPGLGDLLNGGLAFLLLVAAGVIAALKRKPTS
jgi:hypothetical protein